MSRSYAEVLSGFRRQYTIDENPLSTGACLLWCTVGRRRVKHRKVKLYHICPHPYTQQPTILQTDARGREARHLLHRRLQWEKSPIAAVMRQYTCESAKMTWMWLPHRLQRKRLPV